MYKGYSLSKDTEDYLLSRGLKNALYTIRAADLTEDLFGMLVPCPFKVCNCCIVFNFNFLFGECITYKKLDLKSLPLTVS